MKRIENSEINADSMIGDIGSESHVPRSHQLGIGTIRESIRFLVIVRTQFVTLGSVRDKMCIRDRFNIVLGLCAVVLIYICYASIMGPINFEKTRKFREKAVIALSLIHISVISLRLWIINVVNFAHLLEIFRSLIRQK